ncbi:response regulator [Pararobbsia alpina]|nr:response regulator [Pararobbsia alpina]
MQTILLVDDDLEILEAWQRLLRMNGYSVVTAVDGSAGLAAANEIHPALIVTDHSMPGMGGVEFCRQLKLVPKLATVPVVLTSADYKSISATPIWDEFWQKPVPTKAMIASIERLLARPSSPP